MFNKSSPWIWKGVSATLQSGRYTLSYPRGRNKVLVWRLMPYLLRCCKSTSMRSFIWVPNKHRPYFGIMLVHRLRIWPNIGPKLGWWIVTSTQFWSNDGPPSTTLAQHWTNIGLENRVIWVFLCYYLTWAVKSQDLEVIRTTDCATDGVRLNMSTNNNTLS